MVIRRMNCLAAVSKRKSPTNEAIVVRNVEVDDEGEAGAENVN
jgi:hypothetical protein